MKNQRWLIVGVLLLLLLSGTGCALSELLEPFILITRNGETSDVTADTPTRILPTPYPTMTPSPTPVTPSSEADPTAVQTEEASFRLEMTESELNDLISDQTVNRESLQIRDAEVTITEQAVIATFNASHASSGLSGEITFIGAPQIVDGELYLLIEDFELGSSFSGFARLIANSVIRSALDDYNTSNGIPIPVQDNVELETVELHDGMLVVTGRIE